MKTQQELMQAYWGPGGTVDMVKEYNVKHECDVKPWECVRTPSVEYENHPVFVLKEDGEYTFALTILYDDKHEEHRPVFAGDKVYDKKIPKEFEVIDSDTLQYGALRFTDLDWDKISWNPPTPKRTFKLEFTEEERKALMCLTSMSQSHVLVDLHNKFTAAARDKEIL